MEAESVHADVEPGEPRERPPGRTRIKICGMTSVQDAAHAVRAGVDALGFIFAAQSPRYIEPELARDIITTLPPFVDAVGVFVNQESSEVEELVQYCGLTVVQLHGEESPEYCRQLPCRVLKSFSLGRPGSPPPEYEAYFGVVEGYVVDTYSPKMAGGTGQVFDWRLLQQHRPPGPVVLAGGLTPANVGEAILAVQPFAVDANSGVETAPGQKDHHAVRQLVAAVRAVDQLLSRKGAQGTESAAV